MNALILNTKYTGTNSKTVIFNDYTPLWDATSAPGGYDLTGVNGYDPNNINTGSLQILIQKLINGVLDTGTVISIPSSEANISDIGGTGFITYEIPLSDYTFEDGIYYFTYTFVDTPTSIVYSKSTYYAKVNTLKCCLDAKLKAIPVCPTCDKSKSILALFEAQMMFEQINLLLECENTIGAQTVLDYLNDFCNIKNCNCN